MGFCPNINIIQKKKLIRKDKTSCIFRSHIKKFRCEMFWGSRKITHNFDASMIFVFGLKLPKQMVQSCVILLLLCFDDIKTKACTKRQG